MARGGTSKDARRVGFFEGSCKACSLQSFLYEREGSAGEEYQVRKSFEATMQSVAGGVALLVGLGGRLAALCTGTAMDAGLRSIAVPRVDEALSRMKSILPRIVLVSGMLPRDEVEEVTRTARSVGAEVVELPNFVTVKHVAHAIARAIALSETGDDDEESVPTVRSYARVKPSRDGCSR
jgi:hypothetical protein